MSYTIEVNGTKHTVDAEGDTPLLWVLRDILDLTGTKYGCGVGLCGACTVHSNGAAVRSCMLPLERVGHSSITTIEGIGASEIGQKSAGEDGWRRMSRSAGIAREGRSCRPPRCLPIPRAPGMRISMPQCPAISAAAAATPASAPRSSISPTPTRPEVHAVATESHRTSSSTLPACISLAGAAAGGGLLLAATLRWPASAARAAAAEAGGDGGGSFPITLYARIAPVGNRDDRGAQSGNGPGHQNRAADDFRGGTRRRVEGRGHRDGGL